MHGPLLSELLATVRQALSGIDLSTWISHCKLEIYHVHQSLAPSIVAAAFTTISYL